MKRFVCWFLLGLVLGLVGWLGVGCQTPDSENMSSRPWNSPTGWEHGLPSGLNEGR